MSSFPTLQHNESRRQHEVRVSAWRGERYAAGYSHGAEDAFHNKPFDMACHVLPPLGGEGTPFETGYTMGYNEMQAAMKQDAAALAAKQDVYRAQAPVPLSSLPGDLYHVKRE